MAAIVQSKISEPKIVEIQLDRRLTTKQRVLGRNLYEHEVLIDNIYNYQYIGKLWIGSHMQEMTFIFDTGSAWTWIPSSDCPTYECPNNHYFYQMSEDFLNTDQIEIVNYGMGSIEGFVVNDDISITGDASALARDVNFINVYAAKELSEVESDGLLGLSPKTYRDGQHSGMEVHLLVDELKASGVIDKAVFAFYLTDYKDQSKMQFGGHDINLVEKVMAAARKDGD